MITELFLLSVIAIWTFLLYKFVTVDRLYFERRNIKYKTQSFALRNIFSFLSGRFTAPEFAERLYNAFQNERQDLITIHKYLINYKRFPFLYPSIPL